MKPLATILATLALLAACSSDDSDDSGGGGDTSGDRTESTTTTTQANFDEPTPENLSLDVITLGKQCFGSAGCNLEYRVDLTVAGMAFDPDVTYEVIYEVQGGEDGPQINTLELTGDTYSVDDSESISTASSDVELTATVTDVLPPGR